KKLLDDKIAELNDGGYETFSYRILNQRDLYNSLLSGTQGEPINLEKISLSNWGKHEQPYEAIYGEIEADEIAILWTKHGDKILAKNLRKFQGSTTVNSQIRLTLSKRPSDFWYFNNGITVLCKGISKGPLHGSNRSTGIFSFKDISVVNGAQTVGSIGEVSKSFPEEVKNAKVQIRFINLEDAPEDYAKEITKFNNTQNKIESKDFAALDPNQDRLRNELFLDQKRYVYKSGDSKPKRDEGCDIEEATTALACSHPNVELTIQVQREIGRIWEDIDKHPYKSIFNEKVSGVKLWRTVQIARMVEDYLSDYIIFNSDFDRLLAIHGGKLILNKVFKLYGYHKLESRNPDFEIDKGEIITSTERIYEILAQSVNQLYPKVYLNSLFKNKTKTLRLSESIDNSLGISRNLFS
ncbi:MAG: AIPR family protein, partial [Bacteroidota bacterium]